MKINNAILCTSLMLLSGCSGETDSTLKFATSFAPVYDIVKNLTQNVENVEINCVIGNNEPHDFSPNSTKTIGFVEKCDVFFAYGRNIDSNLKKLNPDKYYEITDGIAPVLRDGVVDPHDWLNPVKYLNLIDNTKNKLIEINPENEDMYLSNYESYILEINKLHQSYRTELLESSLKSDIIVTSHEAFGHLADEYNLIQKGVKDLANHEMTTQDLNNIVSYIKINEIHVIFVEELDEIGSIETVINELKSDNYECTVSTLSAFETVDITDKNDTYLNAMYENLNTLKEYLK